MVGSNKSKAKNWLGVYLMENMNMNNSNRNANLKSATIIANSTTSNIEAKIDSKSIVGKFGWFSFGQEWHLPCIYRENYKRYFSLRIANFTFKKMYPILSDEVYKYIVCKTFQMTEHEAALYNEINMFHCDKTYGSLKFKQNNLLIQEVDVVQMYKFLTFCMWIFSDKKIECPTSLCGYLRAKSLNFSFLPFVNWGNPMQQYIPIFFIDVNNHVTSDMQKIEGWPLTYLKFLCRLQNVSKNLLQGSFILTLPLAAVQPKLKDCNFEVYWPDNEFEQLFLNTRFNKENNNGAPSRWNTNQNATRFI